MRTLEDLFIEVGDTFRWRMPLDEVPTYLSYDMMHLMSLYEVEQGLIPWFDTHRGIALDRKPVYWPYENVQQAALSPEDYTALKACALQIIDTAADCSPVWGKWQ